MYPAGKVAISQHLVTHGFPGVTIMSHRGCGIHWNEVWQTSWPLSHLQMSASRLLGLQGTQHTPAAWWPPHKFLITNRPLDIALHYYQSKVEIMAMKRWLCSQLRTTICRSDNMTTKKRGFLQLRAAWKKSLPSLIAPEAPRRTALPVLLPLS